MPLTVVLSGGVRQRERPDSTVKSIYLVTEGEATKLVSINLILRTKQSYGADSYTKKDHFGGNYQIKKDDGHKRQEYSSTVRVRNSS
jgi:hypothetical protein